MSRTHDRSPVSYIYACALITTNLRVTARFFMGTFFKAQRNTGLCDKDDKDNLGHLFSFSVRETDCLEHIFMLQESRILFYSFVIFCP